MDRLSGIGAAAMTLQLAAERPETPAGAPTSATGASADAWARFQELIRASVDFFNAGALDRATVLLDLARRWQGEQGFQAARVVPLLARMSRELDPASLQRAAQRTGALPALRTVLGFFPSLAPEVLLASLRTASQRDHRRFLLTLLVAHGEPVRAIAIATLRRPLGQSPGEDEWFLRRNLLHLLRCIPPTHGVASADEVGLAVQHSRLGLPSIVVKEAVAVLAQARDDRAEIALLRLLAEVSDMLPIRDAFGETNNLSALAGRIASALACYPSERAHRAIVDHAERLRIENGVPMTALAALGRQDLSGDERTVDRLVGMMRRIRRSRVAGILIRDLRGHDDADLTHAVEALASTPLPVVRRALEKIARRFPAQNSGRAAARVLATFARRSIA